MSVRRCVYVSVCMSVDDSEFVSLYVCVCVLVSVIVSVVRACSFVRVRSYVCMCV
jgi:hypothetical protein